VTSESKHPQTVPRSKNTSAFLYYGSIDSAARTETVAILKEQALWDLLLIATGAAIGFFFGEPTGRVAGVLAGAIGALALVVIGVGAWCIAWAPVNLHRRLLAEYTQIEAEQQSLEARLDEGKDEVGNAVEELRRSGHLQTFRTWGKEFILGTGVFYSGFNNDGIRDLKMMKLIRAERVPNPRTPLAPLPGGIPTGYREPSVLTHYVFTELGAAVWKHLKDEVDSA
jgi:hypothetical protein